MPEVNSIVVGNNWKYKSDVENEKQILQGTGTKVLHCPSANLKLGSGIAPIPEYINRGINVQTYSLCLFASRY